MVKIQVDEGYLNVVEGTAFPITFSVGDIRDVSKKTGSRSKTIKLVGDDNNNIILSNYYDVNIEAGTFDINIVKKCIVIQDDIPIMEDAYLQLVSIDKIEHSDGEEETIVYSALVKDSRADFFTVMNNKELTDLDFSDLNHNYAAARIVSTFTNTVADGYVYPLGVTASEDTHITDYRPAIYLQTYWDRIHSTNGFSYEMNVDIFDKLIIPYNGDQPKVDYTDYQVEFNKASFIPVLGDAVTTWTETLDDQNLFNPVTGRYTPPFYIGVGQAINWEVTIDFDFNLVNGTGADAYMVDLLTTAIDVGREYNPVMTFRKNGLIGQSISGNLIQGVLPNYKESDGALPNGTTNLHSGTITLNIGQTNLVPSDFIDIVYQVFESGYAGSFFYTAWKDAPSVSGADVVITSQLSITSVEVKGTVSVNGLGFGQEVVMNNFIPQKTKQKDLVKSITTAFHLVVDVDPDNQNKLIYKTNDDYYDEGVEKNWSLKRKKDSPQVIKFLPELSKKRLHFTYKDGKDSYNETYLDAIRETYGQAEYIFDNEFIKGIERKELIFAPTPTILNSFNAVVPTFVGSAPKNQIRLLIHNGQRSCDPFHIYDYGTSGQTGLTSYPNIGHFDDPYNPTIDINFAVCDYYFYDGITLTNNNLFNMHWRRTMAQINKGIMLIEYFDLHEDDIATMKLNDKIWTNGSWWHINQVLDYDANSNEFTKVELFSVDDEIELPSFIVKPVKPTGPLIGHDPIDSLLSVYYKQKNTNYSQGSTVIKGTGNTVLPNVKAIVIGNDGYIDSDGYWLNGSKIGDDGDDTPSEDHSFLPVSTDYDINCEFDEIVEAIVNNITLTLPNRRECIGKIIYIKNASTGKIDITTATSFIDGDVTIKLRKKEALTVTSDGNEWIIL